MVTLCFSIPELTTEENTQLNLGVARMRKFGLTGRERGLHLLVDAEYTYMNRGISAFALALMVALNTVRTSRILSDIIIGVLIINL